MAGLTAKKRSLPDNLWPGEIPPKRSFQRRTKATSPPETEETTTPLINTENTNKFLRRGVSKFKGPKTVEKSTLSNSSDIEIGGKPSPNGGAERSEYERPAKRGFVRRRQGGVNGAPVTTPPTTTTSTTLPPAPSSTRKGFRIANRRRPISTPSSTTVTTTTETPSPSTTTPAPTTTEFVEESVQDIGDIDAIEDPSLEPQAPKKATKVQRRPLQTLKDTGNDQNPSATNEEENKRQSKKYSATFKQNQLENFLKSMTTEDVTTELGTTVGELSPETALALAAFQLLTAPLPSTLDFDESTKPIKPAKTQEYQSTSSGYNEYTNSQYPAYEDSSSSINTGRPNYSETPSYLPELETPKITPTDYETSNPTLFDAFPTRETITGISTLTFDYNTPGQSTIDSPKPTYAFPARNVPAGFSTAPPDYGERSTRISTSDTNEPTSISLSSKFPRRFTYSTKSDETRIPDFETTRQTYGPSSQVPRRVTVSTVADDARTPAFETTKQTLNTPAAQGSRRLVSSTVSDDIRVPAFETSRQTSTNPSTKGSRRLTFATVSDEARIPTYETTRQAFTNPSSKRRLTISTIPEETPSISTLFDLKATDAKTVTEQYYETTRYDASTLTVPRLSSTSTPKSTASGIRSRQRVASPSIFRPGYSGVSPLVSTEKYVTPDEFGYSTATPAYPASSQDPSLHTRDYLLESPVTKSYDEEYQYLLPVTSPKPPPRKVIRKKVQRRISTTLRPTISSIPEKSIEVPSPPSRIVERPSSTIRTVERPSSTLRTVERPSSTIRTVERSSSTARTIDRSSTVATEKPKRTPTKKPFEKITAVPPSRTFRPIINYDYYDDSEEKVVEKYAEGTKVVLHVTGSIECLDIGNFPHPTSCKKFISCARMESGALLGWEYICPKGLSFDPVGGICNWSAGLGCVEKETS